MILFIISLIVLSIGVTIRTQNKTQEKIENETTKIHDIRTQYKVYDTPSYSMTEEEFKTLIKTIIKERKTITAIELAQILEISVQKASYYLHKLVQEKELYSYIPTGARYRTYAKVD